MAERRRLRRNPPALDAETGRARRRRRGGPEKPTRRRRGGRDAPAQANEQTPTDQSTRSAAVATEVTLPELGESVTEGTITGWLVEVGERVEADQPLFELSSDKIDTEVPAPVSGVLKEIKVDVDETVDVGTVVAIIGAPDEAEPDEPEADGPEADRPEADRPEAKERTAEKLEAERAEAETAESPHAASAEAEPPGDASAEETPEPEAAEAVTPTYERTERVAAPSGDSEAATDASMSPLVRRIVADHDIDVSQISGSGKGGRITREDVEAALKAQTADEPAEAEAEAEPKAKPKATREPRPSPKEAPEKAPQPVRKPTIQVDERTRVEDLSRIRQRIAAKMMESLQSSAQLTTVQEADATEVMQLRERVKDEFQAREGVSLSPFVFFCRAAVLAIRNHPKVNALADWEAGQVAYHDYVNLGIAVDTEKGLIVPNVKGADDLSLAGLARAIVQAADKARGRAKDKSRLEISDIQGGTFTVTNIGSRGALIDTPILNYPEVAILGTGVVKKRPVVVEDSAGPAIAIRDMTYLCLTYDHRLIDGADAARFVTAVKEIVETHDWAAEVGYG